VGSSAALEVIGPGAVLESWNKRHRPGAPLVVVAASGGGIQASGWTAQVLTGLEEKCEDFHRNLALISAVSGGSLGAARFVDRYGANGSFPNQQQSLREIVERAERPSLSQIAWGLIYPDFLRTVLAIIVPRDDDRGVAMELGWRESAEDSLAGAQRSDWRRDLSHAAKPGVIFNATVAETGERLLLSTFDPPPEDINTKTTPLGRQDFVRLYGENADIGILTAVRLSASFPYVSPMPRADSTPDKPFHIADGGYYDNFGVVSALKWIERVATDNTNHLPPGTKIALLQIVAEPPGRVPAAQPWRWYRQGGAPVAALLAVRTSAQLGRNQDSILALQQRLQNPIPGAPSIEMHSFVLRPNQGATPLSWQLSREERKRITTAWENQTPAELQTVLTYLGCAAQ